MEKKLNIIFILALVTLEIIVFSIAMFSIAMLFDIRLSKQPEITNIEIDKLDSAEFADQLLTYIFDLRLEHPYIVFAQAIEESGHFKSEIFQENNNLFGMKMPWSRATTAIGINRGHAVYTSWRQSVIDYAFFQMSYMRGLTREEYLLKLSKSYAENKKYVANLKRIIERTNRS